MTSGQETDARSPYAADYSILGGSKIYDERFYLNEFDEIKEVN